jgi:hypothetical protein
MLLGLLYIHLPPVGVTGGYNLHSIPICKVAYKKVTLWLRDRLFLLAFLECTRTFQGVCIGLGRLFQFMAKIVRFRER